LIYDKPEGAHASEVKVWECDFSQGEVTKIKEGNFNKYLTDN